jgi:hypothetical protein
MMLSVQPTTTSEGLRYGDLIDLHVHRRGHSFYRPVTLLRCRGLIGCVLRCQVAVAS